MNKKVKRTKPHISFEDDETVSLEWWSGGDRKLTLFVGPDGISALRIKGPNIHSDMEEIDFAGPEFLGWLNEV